MIIKTPSCTFIIPNEEVKQYLSDYVPPEIEELENRKDDIEAAMRWANDEAEHAMFEKQNQL